MEPSWLKEVLFAGQTGNGFKLGTAMSLGWFWARINGCRIAYRGGNMETIDFDDVLAVAGAQADEIPLPGFVSHEPGKDYFYVVRCANRCGQIERTLKAAVKAAIDEEGGLREARPNSVFGLAARQTRDGQVEIAWGYNPIEQASGPSQMRVYSDEGTGEVDYQEPVEVVRYKGRGFYQHKGEPAGDGRYLFAVRTADASGNERESMKKVAVETGGVRPEAIEIVGVV